MLFTMRVRNSKSPERHLIKTESPSSNTRAFLWVYRIFVFEVLASALSNHIETLSNDQCHRQSQAANLRTLLNWVGSRDLAAFVILYESVTLLFMCLPI